MPFEHASVESVVPSRTVTVVLPEAEWHAFSQLEPDPVGWLRDLIRERLSSADTADDRHGHA